MYENISFLPHFRLKMLQTRIQPSLVVLLSATALLVSGQERHSARHDINLQRGESQQSPLANDSSSVSLGEERLLLPSLTVEPRESIIDSLHEPVRLRCQATLPPDIGGVVGDEYWQSANITWLINGQPLTRSNNIYTVVGQQLVINLESLEAASEQRRYGARSRSGYKTTRRRQQQPLHRQILLGGRRKRLRRWTSGREAETLLDETYRCMVTLPDDRGMLISESAWVKDSCKYYAWKIFQAIGTDGKSLNRR